MKHVHFIGVCGTAMGAVASAMARRGYEITGSDANAYPPMSTFLGSEGIKVSAGYSEENIPENAELIVVGNAISRGNPEAEAVLNRHLRFLSLPETLKEFFLCGKHNYVVTGTHGKTTTTSMLTWFMEHNGMNPSFMIGGIARNLDRGGRFTDSDYCVLEGDEYDTAFFDKRSKFLHYLPEVVIINNIEMDHADIYANVEEIKLSFKRLMRVVPSSGMVFLNADCPNCLDVREAAARELSMVRTTSVGKSSEADVVIADITETPEGSTFTLNGEPYRVPMVCECNVRNAAMAICAARFAGLEPDQIREALECFEGVARRQELRGTVNGGTVLDDFAHHPTAIRASIEGIRKRFPNRRIWAIFDPRSNTTSRNIFQHELAEALSDACLVVLSPIENPRKVPVDQRLNEEELAAEIRSHGKECYIGKSVDDIVRHVVEHAHPGDVLVAMSNGGFGGIHCKLLAELAKHS